MSAKATPPAISGRPGTPASQVIPCLFAGVFGAFLGLALLKFGNPPIMEKYTTTPEDIYQVIFASPWPIGWAYAMLVALAVVGLGAVQWRRDGPVWVLFLALAWLAWQFLAASRSVDQALSAPTVRHFAACVLCLLLGLFALSTCNRIGVFWSGLAIGFMIVICIGWEQHFGGLQRTRDYFYLYIYPTMAEVPPEYLKKISSNRVFSTLFYPNSLAGALLLLVPGTLGVVWHLSRERFTVPARCVLLAVVSSMSMACLLWSGSKGGWLLMLVLIVVAMLRMPLGISFKAAVISLILVCGGTAFAWKYSEFFKKGATSVGARFDYWRAAVQVVATSPVFGTGPGTFSRPYAQLKDPQSEMTRLVHNDYLEQASDSGFPGFLTFTAFIVISMVFAYPRSKEGLSVRFLAWLGVLGWSLQCLIDFSLYVPALAWCALAMLGWLLGTGPIPVRASHLIGVDSRETST